jgi:hypothetical protein
MMTRKVACNMSRWNIRRMWKKLWNRGPRPGDWWTDHLGIRHRISRYDLESGDRFRV